MPKGHTWSSEPLIYFIVYSAITLPNTKFKGIRKDEGGLLRESLLLIMCPQWDERCFFPQIIVADINVWDMVSGNAPCQIDGIWSESLGRQVVAWTLGTK